MSNRYYLTIDGIHCNAAYAEDPNSFELLSFTFIAPPKGRDPTSPPDLHIVKAHDNVVSPSLVQARLSGRRFGKTTLFAVRTDEKSSDQQVFMKYTMSNAYVVASEIGADYDGFTLVIENLNIEYGVNEPVLLTAVEPDQQRLIHRLALLAQQRLM